MFRDDASTLTLQDWPVTREPLAAGDIGISQTVGKVCAFIHSGSFHPHVLQAAHYMARNCPVEKHECIFSATSGYIRSRFHFFRESRFGEIVRAPWIQVDALFSGPGYASGDCDCLSALQGAIWAALGYKVRVHVFAIPKPDKQDQKAYNHIRAEAFINGRWTHNDFLQPANMKYIRDYTKEA